MWRLLQFSWNRHYQGMWQAMQSYQWGPQLAPLIEALAIKTRQELMELVSLAYATVSPAKVASLCGMTEAEVLNGEAVWGRRGVIMSRPCRGCGNLCWKQAGDKVGMDGTLHCSCSSGFCISLLCVRSKQQVFYTTADASLSNYMYLR